MTLDGMKPELLGKVLKWMRTRNIGIILLAVVIIISAGLFSTTARATDDKGSYEDGDLLKAYFAYYNGHKIGLVQDRADVEAILEDVRQEFQAEFDMETILECHMDFEEIYVDKNFLCNLDDIEKIVRTNAEPKVKSAVIQSNGQEMGILKDRQTAQSILDLLQEPYKDRAKEAKRELEEIGFEEDVSIEDSYVEFEKLEDADEVLKRLMEGDTEKQIYVVEKGDNIWIIADKHDMTVKEILEANAPMEESDILQIGQELNLNVPDLPINILTVEKVKYTKSIPFETETKKSDSLYTNQTKVSQEGANGQKEIVDKVYKKNGVERDRENISETIIKEPVKRIVLEGTKKPVKRSTSSRGSGTTSTSSTSGSGSMSWPTNGSLSSRFGRRWGRHHSGIDIANKKGTPIYAADSGTVSYSGFNSGGYGNLIKINHGGGISTWYAHLSSRLVSSGQSVKKGQVIGYMGSTGRSTGPHLHFEVRVNGSAKNPLNYLK